MRKINIKQVSCYWFEFLLLESKKLINYQMKQPRQIATTGISLAKLFQMACQNYVLAIETLLMVPCILRRSFFYAQRAAVYFFNSLKKPKHSTTSIWAVNLCRFYGVEHSFTFTRFPMQANVQHSPAFTKNLHQNCTAFLFVLGTTRHERNHT